MKAPPPGLYGKVDKHANKGDLVSSASTSKKLSTNYLATKGDKSCR